MGMGGRVAESSAVHLEEINSGARRLLFATYSPYYFPNPIVIRRSFPSRMTDWPLLIGIGRFFSASIWYVLQI